MNLPDVLEISGAMCSFTTLSDCTTLVREHSWWQRVTGFNIQFEWTTRNDGSYFWCQQVFV